MITQYILLLSNGDIIVFSNLIKLTSFDVNFTNCYVIYILLLLIIIANLSNILP